MKRLIGALIVALILLLYIGYFFVSDEPNLPFADTVMFVMALVGLLVALASIGIWVALKRILQEDIEKKISQAEEATRNEALARMAAKVSDSFWAFYEEKQNVVFREQAIAMATDARNIIEGRERVDTELLKCRIYNNLAYAFTERKTTEDTALAHYLIDKVMENINNYPDNEVAWLDTYASVHYILPKQKEDKAEAQEIARKLLERPDISDKLNEYIRERYDLT